MKISKASEECGASKGLDGKGCDGPILRDGVEVNRR